MNLSAESHGSSLSSAAPRWKNETKYILLNNLNESLTMTVFDENSNRSDSNCGIASFDLKTLEEDAEQTDVSGEVQLEGKSRGRIRFDAVFSPVLTAKKLPDGTVEPVPETSKHSRRSYPQSVGIDADAVLVSLQSLESFDSSFTLERISMREVGRSIPSSKSLSTTDLFIALKLSNVPRTRSGNVLPNSSSPRNPTL